MREVDQRHNIQTLCPRILCWAGMDGPDKWNDITQRGI